MFIVTHKMLLLWSTEKLRLIWKFPIWAVFVEKAISKIFHVEQESFVFVQPWHMFHGIAMYEFSPASTFFAISAKFVILLQRLIGFNIGLIHLKNG